MSRGERGVQILTATFVVLLVASLLISYYQSRSILQNELFEVAQVNAHHSAEMVIHWLEGLTRHLLDLAELSDIQSMDWQRPLLEFKTTTDRDWLAICIADQAGRAKSTSGASFDIAGS